MKIIKLSLLPVFLAAVVLAQDDAPAATPDQLIKKLGHEDYEVREQATKQLIELGDKAVPALEKALSSEDLEVRLRASRALRAIRGDKREKVQETSKEPQPANRHRRTGVNMTIQPGKVVVTVTELDENGKAVTKTYEAESVEALKKEHPELKDVLPHFDIRSGRDGFDMDRFWRDWNKDFNEDMQRFRSDLQRDMERWQRWLDAAREQRRRGLPEWARPGDAGPTLGVRASRASRVLDAQLELRGRGVVIDAVEKGSLADSLGLKRFDVLVELAGKPVRDLRDVILIVRGLKEGEKLTAKVYRRAKILELSAER